MKEKCKVMNILDVRSGNTNGKDWSVQTVLLRIERETHMGMLFEDIVADCWLDVDFGDLVDTNQAYDMWLWFTAHEHEGRFYQDCKITSIENAPTKKTSSVVGPSQNERTKGKKNIEKEPPF